jgi:hypothetical protein
MAKSETPPNPVALKNRDRTGDGRHFSPSAARNSGPIREVLERVLPKSGIALEIGSGTGEHVICFAEALSGLLWQPSDPDPASRASIAADCRRGARQYPRAGRHRRPASSLGRGGRRTV